MDVEYLRAHFLESVQTMFEENYVDDYFKLLCLEHWVADSPDIAPDCIRSFFVDVEKHMDEIGVALRQFPVDFKQITLGTVRIMRKMIRGPHEEGIRHEEGWIRPGQQQWRTR